MTTPCVNGRAAVALLLVLAALSPTVSSAQTAPQIDFRNRIAGILDAPVFDSDGITPLAGPNWFAQLFVGSTPDSLAAIGSPVYFLEGAEAGYWTPDTVSVPWARPGDTVSVQVRVLGYLHCVEPFPQLVPRAVSRIVEVTTGNSPVPLLALESFSIVRPTLFLEHRGNQVVLSWVYFGQTSYRLEQSDTLGPWAVWRTLWTLTDPCAMSYGQTLTMTFDSNGTTAFYRLSM